MECGYCRGIDIVSGLEAELDVVVGVEHVLPRGTAPPSGTLPGG